jgi:hypothetical protein
MTKSDTYNYVHISTGFALTFLHVMLTKYEQSPW